MNNRNIQPKTEPRKDTSPLARADHAGRVWGGKQTNQGVQPWKLKGTKKYRPEPGSARFCNGVKAKTKDNQQWKFWTGDKYIYASSKGGKGWVKA